MPEAVSGALVLLTGGYLVGFALFAFARPAAASRFLERFAGSARAHYLEQSLRLVAGVAMLLHAPKMRLAGFFTLFGWILVLTTIGLFLVPWRWHHRFGQWAIPLATRHIRLYAIGSLLLGVLVLACVLLGSGFARLPGA